MVLGLVCSHRVTAQVWEDFSDGDLSHNPAWFGDTNDFRINSNNQLQLYTDHADSSAVWFPYALPDSDTLTWEAWIKLGFSPSAQNYAVLYFCTADQNLWSATHRLVALVGAPGFSTHPIDIVLNENHLHLPYRPRLSTNTLRMKLEMVRHEALYIWLDTLGRTDSTDYVLMGTLPADDELPHNAYFGVYNRYTVSRAKNFFFDDIGINRTHSVPPPPPPQAPLFPGDLLVNEVLFNPEPGGADYVELYNNTDSSILLNRIRLAKMAGDSIAQLHPIADTGLFPPRQLLVVTTDAHYVSSHYTVRHPNKLVEVGSMPSYNDDAGSVVICSDSGIVMDRFDYNEKMHSRLLRTKEGVALERRSLSAPTQDSSNWYSAASTAGYGTPTYTNSQSREFLFVDDDFTIATTLFSPDGDGYNDLLDITYSLSDCSLTCNIDIYDAQGRMVRRLSRGMLLGCEGVISWDGTDQQGRRCQRGNYLIVAEAYNANGVRQSWRRRVSLVTN